MQRYPFILIGSILCLNACVMAQEPQVTEAETETIEAKDLSLQGVVLDRDRKPVDGVKISNWFPFGSNPQSTYTDDKGEFYFKERRGYVVWAEKAGFAPAYEEFRDKLYDQDASAMPIRLQMRLTRGGVVEGRILDAEGNKPIPNAQVWIERAAKDPHVGNLPHNIWTSQPAITDDKGRFRVELAPSGRVQVRAKKDGYFEDKTEYFTLQDTETKVITLLLKQKTLEDIQREKQKELELSKRDISLSGVVVDLSGDALDGVQISNFHPHGSNPQRTFTDHQGEFRFERERGYVLIAEKVGYAPYFHEFKDDYHQRLHPQQKPIHVKITMNQGGVVEGSILTQENNAPVEGVEVWIDRWAKDTDVGQNPYIIWKSKSVKTDADGCFHIEHAPIGALRLHAKSSRLAENISPKFSVGDGLRKEIVLKLFPGVDVTFQAIDKKTQQPVSSALIRISDAGERRTDAMGVCVFHSLAPRAYSFYCQANGYHDIQGETFEIDTDKGSKKIKILMLQR